MRRVACVAFVASLLACSACNGGAARTGGARASTSTSFVGRYYAGAAHLVWDRHGGVLRGSMDVTHPGPGPTAVLVHDHLDLGVNVDGSTVTLAHGSDTPWSGNLDGRDLVLSWAPDGVNLVTTTFTPGNTADFQAAAADAAHQYAAEQQAIARRVGTAAAAQAAKAAAAQAARQGAHLAAVARTRAAHDAKVAAMRASHDAQVAAMQQRQAAARAKAAAHHHP